ncbi:filamentous hemagglutinin N-terminal domain-containing protein [Gilliamella sp. CG13]|uniref:two-partner secretion domain-containing protein n=1 Tax=Gilliamella sp. CG13 TaxID=3351502 RepID=UPI0039878DA3
MNKNFFRIVFNKTRGLYVVVSEMVSSHQVMTSHNQTTKKIEVISKHKNQSFMLKPLVFLSYIALGMVGIVESSYANNIVVDQNANQAQRPAIQGLPNGVTQIDIATPTKGGVSHNKYTQFDVSKNGVILNNSRDGSKTQLAGDINGNASLQNSAKVILNEVNSQNISQLNGYIEVAGQKAQVIIANPAGITCNGCGFINADRATLTTGKALMKDGQLIGYHVEKGQIAITGDGLKNSGQDYTDLIARSVNVNAKLWANKEITIVTGQGKVKADLTKIEKIVSDPNTAQPEFALDVSALGGMYAGKIKMIGTETGVGVRNNGILMANAGTLNLSVDGKILNNVGGNLKATKDILLNSQQIENHGTIAAQKNVSLMAKTEVKNYGTVEAKEDINLKASKLVANEGKLSAGKNITSFSQEFISTWTGNINAVAITITAKRTKNVGRLRAQMIKISANYTENAGNVSTTDKISVSGDNIKNDWEGKIESADVDLEGKNVENYGEVEAKDKLNIVADDVTNENKLTSEKDLIVHSDNITNKDKGSIQAGENVSLEGNNIVNEGEVKSPTVNLGNTTESKITNTSQGKIIAEDRINVNGMQFDNHGWITGNWANIRLTNGMYNNGNIAFKDKMELNIKNLKNDWQGILKSSKIRIKNDDLGTDLTNFGVIDADNMNLQLEEVSNFGQLLAKESLSLNASKLENGREGIIKSNKVKLSSSKIYNYNQIIAKEQLEINSTEILYNQGKLLAQDKIAISSNYFKNDWLGEVNADEISLNGITVNDLVSFEDSRFDNYNKVTANKNLKLDTADIYNQAKLIAVERLTTKSTNFKNDWQAEISANKIEINSENFDNRKIVNAKDKLVIKAGQIYNNGEIFAKNEIYTETKQFKNDWLGIIKTNNINVAGGNNINNLGTINVDKLDNTQHNQRYKIENSASEIFFTLDNNTFSNDKQNTIKTETIISNITDMIIFHIMHRDYNNQKNQ